MVYSRVGGGHLSAARAIATELESTRQCVVRTVDAYLECGRFPATLIPAAYARLARRHPHLWSIVYHGSTPKIHPELLVDPFVRGGFRQVMSAERPDVVISVLPVINGPLARAAAPSGARLEVVLTDWHAVHPLWQARGVDHYTTATDSARAECITFGAPPSAVEVVGIPVRREFSTPQARRDRRQRHLSELGLDPQRFTILAMAGAEGSPATLRNLAFLASQHVDAQMIVVCGRSRQLRQRIEGLPSRIPLRTLGFVDNVADLMRAADVLVTKAGGLTLAEAFCCGIPVVVHDLLPGQEAGNLDYVLRHGAVVHAPRPSVLVRVISELMADPARRAALADRGARLARPEAAQRIARDILARLDSSG